MANTVLTVQKISRLASSDLILSTIVDSGDTITFLNVTKNTFIMAEFTGDGITEVLTLDAQGNFKGVNFADATVTIVNGAGLTMRYVIGPFEAPIFNAADSTITITITWSGGTPTAKVAAVGID